MFKYKLLLDNLYDKSKSILAKTFFSIVLSVVSIYTIITLQDYSSITCISLFTTFTGICIYFKMSIKLKYILSILGFTFFIVSFLISPIDEYGKFLLLNEVSYYIPMLYAYILPDIFCPIVSGWSSCLLSLSLLNNEPNKLQIINNCIGIIALTVIITSLGCLIRNLSYQRDMYKALSKKDIITDVLNLNCLLEYGDDLINNGNSLTAYVLDINNFKEINDTFGHLIGNKILFQLADVLKGVVQEYDGIVGRLGGDEFIVLIKNITEESEKAMLQKLNYVLTDKHFEGDKDLAPIKLSCTIGMAHSSKESISMQELLHLADFNMYCNKQIVQEITIDKNLDKVLNDEFKTLVNVLCEKDIYSYIHSQYVVYYSILIAKELNLSEQEINEINLSGWLHDIGKILVPNELLRKRSKLTDDEYFIIKEHVKYGLLILSMYNLSDNVINGVKMHHERWDGKGYPLGLNGKNTPLCARIIQIADSFSAMTIKRVYRDKMSLSEALKEVEKFKGKQFDPNIADKFIDLIKRKLN